MTSDAIQLPDAPGIHGLRFRRFRAGDDFNHMATMARGSAEDKEDRTVMQTVEKVTAELHRHS